MIGIYKRTSDPNYFERLIDILERVVAIRLSWRMGEGASLNKLRKQADDVLSNLIDNISKSPRNIYFRSAVVRAYVLSRAQGVCECCESNAPFRDKKGRPYLESHHINERSDNGLDHYVNMAAICSLCHSQIHHGFDGDKINEKLRSKVQRLESKT